MLVGKPGVTQSHFSELALAFLPSRPIPDKRPILWQNPGKTLSHIIDHIIRLYIPPEISYLPHFCSGIQGGKTFDPQYNISYQDLQ